MASYIEQVLSSPSFHLIINQLLIYWISKMDCTLIERLYLLQCVVDGGWLPPCGQKACIN